MKTLLLTCLLACAGCSTSTITCGPLRAHNTRWAWDTRQFKATITDSNGMSLTLELAKSSANADAIHALGGFAAQVTEAAIKSAKTP